MQKVIILCHDFIPLPSVASYRPESWYNRLPHHGFHPVIVSFNWDDHTQSLDKLDTSQSNAEILKSQDRTWIKIPLKPSWRLKIQNRLHNKWGVVRKSATFLDLVLQWNKNYKDYTYPLYVAAKKYLQNNDVGLIIASGKPFILFKHAYSLSKEFEIPWIADYRDEWTTHPDIPLRLNKLWPIIHKIDLKNEIRFLSNAVCFTTVSQRLIKRISKVYPQAKGYCIENGANLDLLPKEVPTVTDFVILFAGHLYPLHKVDVFIEGLKQFISQRSPSALKVKFVGVTLRQTPHLDRIRELQKVYPGIIEIIDPIPRKDSMKMQAKASILLKFSYALQKDGYFGGKLYEYAAARKPILIVSHKPDENPDFFHGRDIQFFTNTADEVEMIINKFYDQFERGEKIETSITDQEINDLSTNKQVGLLAKLITQVIK